MDISKLYEELGREMAKRAMLNSQKSDLERKWRESRDYLSNKINESNIRAAELYEAIRLASEENVDPLIAKMTARESLEGKNKSLIDAAWKLRMHDSFSDSEDYGDGCDDGGEQVIG